VAQALRRKGAEEVVLWPTSDFPTRAREDVRTSACGGWSFRSRGDGFDFGSHGLDGAGVTVWRRRPAYVLDPERLHPADRRFADTECSVFRRSVLGMIHPRAFWVNPNDAAGKAGLKTAQLDAAAQVGLMIPDTLVSNNPEAIRAFVAAGPTVYKPLTPAGWQGEGDTQHLTYTSLVTPQALSEDDSLIQSPGIYQRVVPKEYELRITVIGKKVFAAKVHSQETDKGKLDWRRAYDELTFTPHTLPGPIEAECLLTLKRLGLVFGCVDMIVTPDGDHVFVEVNESGQFLFVERYCGLPLLDAFAELLLQGCAEFTYSGAGSRPGFVSYQDEAFEAEVLQLNETFRAAHVERPATLADEREGAELRRLEPEPSSGPATGAEPIPAGVRRRDVGGGQPG
jgi:glutathione synthase/RimK-type ligase-like ATP-grasp enzyme